MDKLIIYIGYRFYKEASAFYRPNYLTNALSTFALNITLHIITFGKIILELDNSFTFDFKNYQVLFGSAIFSLFLSYLFIIIYKKRFIAKSSIKYKNNKTVQATGSTVFVLYIFFNSLISILILANVINDFRFVTWLLLPILFFLYWKFCDSVGRIKIKS